MAEAFCRVSGFSLDELKGQPHNLIRHPDMPASVYANFWDTLKAGLPWLGIVKNRCKNGDFYWVSAYVSPVYEDGEVVGYQSVRTAPDREQVRRAERLYARLSKGRRLPTALPLSLKITLALVGSALVGAAADHLLLTAHPLLATLTVACFLAGAFATAKAASGRLERLTRRARALFDNPVGRQAYGGGQDEVAQVELALAMQRAQLNALLGRVDGICERLERVAEDGSALEATRQAVEAQRGAVEQLATAMEQMSATVREISASTAAARSAT